MPNHPKSMCVSFTPEQTARLLAWANKITCAEVEATCEPGGYVIQIEIGGFVNFAVAVRGGERLELGDIDLDFIDVQ